MLTAWVSNELELWGYADLSSRLEKHVRSLNITVKWGVFKDFTPGVLQGFTEVRYAK